MGSYTFRRELVIPRPLAEVFDFFSRAENLEKITPPWLRFRIMPPAPREMKEGVTITYALRIRGIPVKWLTRIERWNPPFEFVDVQLRGPYKSWRHTHKFSEVPGGTCIVDNIDYAVPFGLIGRLVHRFQIARDLSKIFDYRARRVREMLG